MKRTSPPSGARTIKKAESKDIVLSVAKAFRVLHAFSADSSELVLADIARRAELDNGTTFRMLNTLSMLGYVEKVGETRRFRLTLRCLDLGFNAIARMDLRTIAQPILQQLAAPGIGAASIGILEQHEIVYIERVQFGLTRVAIDIRIGSRVPVANSAMGRAILSLFDEVQQRRELASRPLIKATSNTETDVERIIRALRKAREHGLSTVDQEWLPGVIAIAAPIIGADGMPIAAISLATTSYAMSIEKLHSDFGSLLKQSALTIGKAIQASGGIIGGK